MTLAAGARWGDVCVGVMSTPVSLVGLADQVGSAGASEVDGRLPPVQGVECGHADGSFRASAARQQFNHFDAVADAGERQTRPPFVIQRFHVGVVLSGKKERKKERKKKMKFHYQHLFDAPLHRWRPYHGIQ